MHTNDTDNDNDSDNDSDNDNDNDNDNDSDNDKNNESVSFSAKKECVFNTRFIKIYNRLALLITHYELRIIIANAVPKFCILNFAFCIEKRGFRCYNKM